MIEIVICREGNPIRRTAKTIIYYLYPTGQRRELTSAERAETEPVTSRRSRGPIDNVLVGAPLWPVAVPNITSVPNSVNDMAC